jgi:membrane associated rhomboid family serine protease
MTNKVSSIGKRIPYATVAFAILFSIIYSLEPSSRLCFNLSCPNGTHFDWVTQYIAFLGIFIHTSNAHLYGNLLALIALGVPFESFVVTTNSKVRYGVFLASFLISECWNIVKFKVAIGGAFAISYGASGMTSAMIPFVLYALIQSPIELASLRRLVPVSIGIGSAFIVLVLLQDILLSSLPTFWR